MPLSAYIHIPFCTHKCDFCDFAAFAGVAHLEDAYCKIVCSEIAQRSSAMPGQNELATVFYGGGTPGLIAVSNLEMIHKKLLSYLPLTESAEISLETTPHAITAEKAAGWLALGVNRLSIGIESLSDDELAAIGRDHTRAQAYQGIKTAIEAGFKNISIDFMYALPTQTQTSWSKTLADCLALAAEQEAIKHVSAYSLHLAGNSPLFSRFPKDSPQYPSETSFERMYETLVERLEGAGFAQYEVSNFSRPGYRSLHNLAYWNNSDYLAFGVSAHRYMNGVRSSNWRSLKRYMEDCMGDETREVIDRDTRITEAIMLGLRLREGLDLNAFQAEFEIDFRLSRKEAIDKLLGLALVEVKKDRLVLTQKGVPVSNSVIAELI